MDSQSDEAGCAPLLIELLGLYRELDRAIEIFAASSGLACPAGCGRCCEKFNPDLWPLEAELIARHIRRQRPELAEGLIQAGTACPLYEPENPLHCPVYEVRPLACRSFAFSAQSDKHGRAQFRFCAHMPVDGPRLIEEEDFPARFRGAPPLMQSFGGRLAGLAAAGQPAGSGRRGLAEAVNAAIEGLRLRESYQRSASCHPGR